MAVSRSGATAHNHLAGDTHRKAVARALMNTTVVAVCARCWVQLPRQRLLGNLLTGELSQAPTPAEATEVEPTEDLFGGVKPKSERLLQYLFSRLN